MPWSRQVTTWVATPYAAVENGIRCVRCSKTTALDRCGNCGGSLYKLGRSGDGVAVVCIKCSRGTAMFTCDCGTENRVSNRSFMTQLASGCFIATAAFGSDQAGEVVILRSFRDEVLPESSFGEALVLLYYRFSPPIANLIAKSLLLRATIRQVAIRPLAFLAAKLLRDKSAARF